MSNRPPALALIFAATGTLLLALARPAEATVWQPVYTTQKSQTEIDLDSIAKKEGVVNAWVQQVHADLVASKVGAYYVYRTMKMQVRYQCAQHAVAVQSRSFYNDSGVEVYAERAPEDSRVVAPESPEDRALMVACAADPKKAAAALRRTDPVPARYMDGPAPAERRNGLIKTSTDAHAEPAPASAPKTAEGTIKLPEIAIPKPPPPPKAASHDAHAAPAAPAPVSAHGAAHATAPTSAAAHKPAPRDSENREKVVARVMRDRGLGTPAVMKPLETVGHEDGHWDYEGQNAPYRWGDMKTEFSTCKTGQRQSPIDIRNPVMAEMDPIVFHYEESPLKVLNNGHTIQVEIAPGSFILYGGARYELVQFHFHTPSEERVNGRAFDMVIHLVHKSAQGKLAVVAVLLSAGKAHPVIETIWNTMPGTAGRTRERPEVQLNPMSLLPGDRGYYSFQGSLTTPPCTEGVQWLVLKTPVELGTDQIVHFGALYPMNARPLQPTNDRVVKLGR